VFDASSGAYDLRVRGWDVDFDAVIELERGRRALLIQSFFRCCLHVGVVSQSKSVERSDGDAN
jgi:hypothetical protein